MCDEHLPEEIRKIGKEMDFLQRDYRNMTRRIDCLQYIRDENIELKEYARYVRSCLSHGKSPFIFEDWKYLEKGIKKED